MISRQRQATPQQAIAGFREAATHAKWDEALQYLTLDAKKGLIGTLCMEAAYATGVDSAARQDLTSIMQQHGLLEDATKQWQADELLVILRKVLAWFNRCSPTDQQLDLGKTIADTEYSDFRIVGDCAYAIATHKGRRSEQRFKRVDDRWYLS